MEVQAENSSFVLPADSRSIQLSHHHNYDTSCETLPAPVVPVPHHYQQRPLPPHHHHHPTGPNMDQRSLSFKGSDHHYSHHDGGSSTGGSGYHPPYKQYPIGSPPAGGSGHLYPSQDYQHHEYPMGGQYPPYPPHGGRPNMPYHPPQVQQPNMAETGMQPSLQPNRVGPPTYKDLAHPADKPTHQNGKVSFKHITNEPCSFIMSTNVCLFLSISLSAICIFCGAYALFCTVPAIFLTLLAKTAQRNGETAILQANLRITSFCIVAAFVVWLIFSTFIIFMVALTT